MNNLEILKDHIVPYEKRIVAFLDLQGFKDNVIKNYPAEAIGAVFGGFRCYTKLLESDYSNVNITIISDSIVISSKIDNIADIIAFFEVCFYFAKPKIDKNNFIAVRGGISYGDLHHKDDIVFGPALIDAYDICEGKFKSKQLRIRMKKDTFELLNNITGFSKAIVFPEDEEQKTYFINLWLLFFAIGSLSGDIKDKEPYSIVINDLHLYYEWCNKNMNKNFYSQNINEKYRDLLIDIIVSASYIKKVYKKFLTEKDEEIINSILSYYQ